MRGQCIEIANKNFVSEFSAHWEDKFPAQNDAISCGVFVLAYARYRMGLYDHSPNIFLINALRPIIANELYINELLFISKTIFPRDVRCCQIPTSYKQNVGRLVTLKCFCNGEIPRQFQWKHNDNIVSLNQTYSFTLEYHNCGEYVCYVLFNDEQTHLTNTCIVTAL